MMTYLREYLVPEPITQPEYIGLASPADKGDLNLSIFLYQIEENADARQSRMHTSDPASYAHAPVTVNLHYLITAHSSSDLSTRMLDEHRMLGRVIQVLGHTLTLRGSVLQGSLGESQEALRLVTQTLSLEALTKLWNFPNAGYKASIDVMVGPVYIDPLSAGRGTVRVLSNQLSGGGGAR
nr:DUF4255 domain-containing protein [Brevibacillus dissolubilis]